MSRSDRDYWIIILSYSGFLCLSLAVFLLAPAGIAAVTVFPVTLGPMVGSPILALISVVQMLRKKITVATGVGSIAVLAAVSFVCIMLTFPILMGI